MPYRINRNDIPEAGLGSKGGDMTTKLVYGADTSMMYAERPADYHSTPHVHDSEQLNYVLDGEIWIFLENEAVLLGPGDFNRVPELEVHWSKVETGLCTMIESHTPPYVGDPELAGENRELAVGLFSEDEPDEPTAESRNVWAASSYAEHEKELMAAYRERRGD
jgi:quercetin dioxygenase-like cupin family protein